MNIYTDTKLGKKIELRIAKMVEGIKIKDHVDNFNDLFVDLENLGEN